ncbi:MAG: right-handed parallel beta-helix repeat-containing protein, partial [Firmicutes bacterium]|nr:right-handed parallel beta-helix repeat-containing protein [Bacillota bacterium]
MKKIFMAGLLAAFICIFMAGCGGGDSSMTHVSPDGNDKTGDGSEKAPYATIAKAASEVRDGETVLVHEGTYGKVELTEKVSGTKEKPLIIKAADGEKAVIKSKGIGIHLLNLENVTVEGFEIEGGTHGIYYETTDGQEEGTYDNVTIRNCTVHGIRGTHGICVYARNTKVPVKNLTMEGCEVYDCQCGSSESTVFNGNIDGFT